VTNSSEVTEQEVIRDLQRLAELTVRIERYRYVILSAMTWITYGCIFAITCLVVAVMWLITRQPYVAILLVVPYIVATQLVSKLWVEQTPTVTLQDDNVRRILERFVYVKKILFTIPVLVMYVVAINLFLTVLSHVSPLIQLYVLATLWYVSLLLAAGILSKYDKLFMKLNLTPVREFTICTVTGIVLLPLVYLPLALRLLGLLNLDDMLVVVLGFILAVASTLLSHYVPAYMLVRNAHRTLYARDQL
jgi:hypothetical protein